MNPSYDPQTFQVKSDSISSYTAKTFGWMFLGLMTTFAASLAIYFTGAIYYLYNGILPYVLLIAELGVVIYLSARLHKMSIGMARGLFFVYALFNAVTFSSIFAIYSVSSLVFVFGMTALYFGVMALYGMVTKTDLSRIRPVLLFGLITLLVLALLSVFIPGMETGMCLIGVVIFVAFTAYDTQMIRRNYMAFQSSPELLQKASVISALQLYLDFINLFLYLIRLFGKRD
ncbi:Bax inhibitor-1/YccA family protein [Butyricicoccus porcorum]|uniref:Bax inhibitor-1/YccA family protein n=1 Tax=Butyricicoccus porcorum TaxID=1945634 RepID=UPI0029865EA2|nr:Bax inhibitor-1/YccA family protein [Butyricicoccus porcorum]